MYSPFFVYVRQPSLVPSWEVSSFDFNVFLPNKKNLLSPLYPRFFTVWHISRYQYCPKPTDKYKFFNHKRYCLQVEKPQCYHIQAAAFWQLFRIQNHSKHNYRLNITTGNTMQKSTKTEYLDPSVQVLYPGLCLRHWLNIQGCNVAISCGDMPRLQSGKDASKLISYSSIKTRYCVTFSERIKVRKSHWLLLYKNAAYTIDYIGSFVTSKYHLYDTSWITNNKRFSVCTNIIITFVSTVQTKPVVASLTTASST